MLLNHSRRLFHSVRKFSTTSALVNHEKYLEEVAKVDIPKRLSVLLDLLEVQDYVLTKPNERSGLNPFFIPLAKNVKNGSFIGYMRWPTQKESMDLQIAQTNEAGIELLSSSTDLYCHRVLVELDFAKNPNVDALLKKFNAHEDRSYKLGDFETMIKSGKFPRDTEHDLKLIIDRYLLTKVGPFTDCYERLSDNFLSKKNDVSALVTAERSMSAFYGWGHTMTFHTKMLYSLGRSQEAKDTAGSAMSMPKFTLAKTNEDFEFMIKTAGFSSIKVLGDMHKFRSTDPRTKDLEEGLNPIQIPLDQAAHLMDAVALGVIDGGWDSAREGLAQRYRDGGYPDIAVFIESH